MTDLSVVIPARNEAENIRGLLDGIVAALDGVAPFEVIVVDDGSTDATADAVRAAGAADPRIRLLRHPRSAGQSAAVHSGVRAARGRIVCTLDGDGQNPPEELPKLAAPSSTPRPRPARPRRGPARGAPGHLVEEGRLEMGQQASRLGARRTGRATPAAGSRRSGARCS
jgi:glycosyltransferase involved in cell wall biosynthesis